MEIETLRFQIYPPDRVEEFITADGEVWTSWLQQRRGFLRKTYQRCGEGGVLVRIFWASQRDWDAAGRSPEIPILEVKMKAAFLGVFNRIE